jgi:hypothetical protein
MDLVVPIYPKSICGLAFASFLSPPSSSSATRDRPQLRNCAHRRFLIGGERRGLARTFAPQLTLAPAQSGPRRSIRGGSNHGNEEPQKCARAKIAPRKDTRFTPAINGVALALGWVRHLAFGCGRHAEADVMALVQAAEDCFASQRVWASLGGGAKDGSQLTLSRNAINSFMF